MGSVVRRQRRRTGLQRWLMLARLKKNHRWRRVQNHPFGRACGSELADLDLRLPGGHARHHLGLAQRIPQQQILWQ